jgi:5-methylcytosine-specific restriction endonuclease McrA
MRTEFSAKTKTAAALRANGQCEECTRRLMTGDFNYDHVIPDALGGEPTLDNCAVLCRSCHRTKTTKADVPRIAKANRNWRTARGIRKPSQFACSRSSKFKKKISGEVVLR